MRLALALGKTLEEILSMSQREFSHWLVYNEEYGIYDPVWSDAYTVNTMCQLNGNKTKITDHMPVKRRRKESAKVTSAKFKVWALQLEARHRRRNGK